MSSNRTETSKSIKAEIRKGKFRFSIAFWCKEGVTERESLVINWTVEPITGLETSSAEAFVTLDENEMCIFQHQSDFLKNCRIALTDTQKSQVNPWRTQKWERMMGTPPRPNRKTINFFWLIQLLLGNVAPGICLLTCCFHVATWARLRCVQSLWMILLSVRRAAQPQSWFMKKKTQKRKMTRSPRKRERENEREGEWKILHGNRFPVLIHVCEVRHAETLSLASPPPPPSPRPLKRCLGWPSPPR